MSKKASNPPPPAGAMRPPAPPAPPAPPRSQIKVPRKLARKLRRAYVKQARVEFKDSFEKARELPFRKRLRLALILLGGK